MPTINKKLALSQGAVKPFRFSFRQSGVVPTNFANWTFLVVVRDSDGTTIGISGSVSAAATGEVTFTPTLTDLGTLTAGDLTGEVLYKVDGAGDAYTAGRLTGALRSGESWT